MAAELRQKMEAAPGGTSRFGALSTVLFEMGDYWRMYSPPCTHPPIEPRTVAACHRPRTEDLGSRLPL